MTCTHRDSLGRWTTGIVYGTIIEPDLLTTKPIGYRCAKCGGLCALGEANDGGEHAASVAVEKRGLWLSEQFAPVDRSHADSHEVDGWYCHRDGYAPNIDDASGQAGYLARVIATHAEGE